MKLGRWGTDSTWDQKTRTVGTCLINTGSFSLKIAIARFLGQPQNRTRDEARNDHGRSRRNAAISRPQRPWDNKVVYSFNLPVPLLHESIAKIPWRVAHGGGETREGRETHMQTLKLSFRDLFFGSTQAQVFPLNLATALTVGVLFSTTWFWLLFLFVKRPILSFSDQPFHDHLLVYWF